MSERFGSGQPQKIICNFGGEYEWLSNFYPCRVEYKGLTYLSSEAAFQAQKVLDDKERVAFTSLNAHESKKLGRKVKLRKDWDDVKDEEMANIVKAKFTQNRNLKRLLICEADGVLVEGNTWHDNYWGDCFCEKCRDKIGENRLGIILMNVRRDIIAENEKKLF